MKLNELTSIEQMGAFVSNSAGISFDIIATKAERYQVAEKLLRRFHYATLKRAEKGIMIRFLIKILGYSRQQITRMVQRFKQTGKLKPLQKTAKAFERIYLKEDVRLLAKLDQLHDTPNGLRVKKLCERAYNRFNDIAYQRLAMISVSHIYNLRKSTTYQRSRCLIIKTKSNKTVQIGERRKPFPDEKAGFIRIDTVHQGDFDGIKGVYHINAVDEVTQFEAVVSVERISETYLIPALKVLFDTFPFKIINFHSDNGSEFVNKIVAKLLNKLLIEFTKSRPRQSNDNALVEGKNAAIVRKMYGYAHIPQHFAQQLNHFNENFLNPYINYHRPCLFPITKIDKKGKQKKVYQYQNTMTPYEKLKSLENASAFLKHNLSFEVLDDFAYKISDNDSAALLQKERKLLFKNIHEAAVKYS